ncbi:GpE family phage tail protein [Thalassobius sp. I31.1]|nr:GpE family phage tail protein [Thalassobius sp. I31.1]
MADIASVFHWAPSEMDPMPPEELVRWREKARARREAETTQTQE